MYLYGICIDDIMNIKKDGIIELLKILDIYQECMNDCEDNDDYILDWVENYESMGYFGLGALLYDVMTTKELCDINIDDPNGNVFLGLSATYPWNYNSVTRNMSEEDFNEILRKYICLITDDELEIRMWNISDDCDW